MVVSSFPPVISISYAPRLLSYLPKSTIQIRHHGALIPTSSLFSAHYVFSTRRRYAVSSSANENPPRTLFPGGYKRPEVKVPSLVLRLSSDEVFRDNKAVLDVVDDAVSGRVGIVVLVAGEGGGKTLYEAACLLKSVIRERAYFLIDERVDIAAAVNASGVLLSDQGLPTIVARNTMMDAKNESVVLPLVARNVQSYDAALDASNFEGADFLIFTIKGNSLPEKLVGSVFGRVKIPTFIMVDSLGYGTPSKMAQDLLRSGASGIVVSVDELKLFKEDDLDRWLFRESMPNQIRKVEDSSQGLGKIETMNIDNGYPQKKGVAGFVKLEEREQQFIEKERSVLLEAINAIQRATPLMGELSLLRDAVSQLDEPFLLVIVVIVRCTSTNSGSTDIHGY